MDEARGAWAFAYLMKLLDAEVDLGVVDVVELLVEQQRHPPAVAEAEQLRLGQVVDVHGAWGPGSP